MSDFVAELQVGAVIIGRNEGQRLVNCFESLLGNIAHIVYVDSDSSDNSLLEAQKYGVGFISLDMSIPFTAARARNEGAAYLVQKHSELKYIQFIDGDCEIQADWVDLASQFLENNSQYAVVCGRRRERFPEKSIYNQLCDIEWNTPVGDAKACGGDALIRASAFKQVNGYDNALIAGEEPEMCFRLREKGWKIMRFDAEMTLHDAAMTKLSQWWNRSKRSGYAYASSCYLHGNTSEFFKVKEILSIILWVLIIPILIILLSLINPWFAMLVTLYPLQILKIVLKLDTSKMGNGDSIYYALSIVIAKFPQFLGMIKFGFNTFIGIEGRLIEYK